MPAPFLAMLGPWEILVVFVVFAVFATVVLGVVVWIVHAVSEGRKRAQAAPPPPGGPRTPPAPPAFAGSVVGEMRTGNCPRCGTALAEGAPAGLCPRCLLAVGMGTEPAAPGAGAANAAGTAVDPAELAKHFPQLEILEPLGQGGMGIVYRARQRKLDRFVALKVLPTEAARDPAFAERFHREARALARLNHPNIITVHDFGEVDGLFYLLMEYVDGADLRRVLEQGRLSPAEALRIVPIVCDALQYAHANGVVHRDIKPGNILLDREGRVKIADFGIAKLAGAGAGGGDITLTQSRQAMGTPHYMAPEQVENPQSVDHRADIYSLGVVFYEMLTGELPLGRFAPPSRRVQVDVRLDEVVLRALEKEPGRRYQQAGEVRTELERIAGPERRSAPGPAALPTGGAGPSAGPVDSAMCTAGLGWKATVAAMWPALFVLFLGWFLSATQGRNPLGIIPTGLAWIGAWAPLGTTLLGWLTLREVVRRGDSGRRRWFALGLTVLFPVIAVWSVGLAFVAVAVTPLLGFRDPVPLVLIAAVMSVVVAAGGLQRIRRMDVTGARPGIGRFWEWTGQKLARFPLVPGVAFLLLVGIPTVFLLIVAGQESASRNRRGAAWPSTVPAVAVDPMYVDPSTGMPVEGAPWEETPAGLAWRDWARSGPLAGLNPAEVDAVGRALNQAWQEHRNAARLHVSSGTNDLGHTVVVVRRFPGELDAIENRFWTTVDQAVTPPQRATLRSALGRYVRARGGAEVSPPPGYWVRPFLEDPRFRPLLAIGEQDLTVEYWQVGTWYRWAILEGVAATEGVTAELRAKASEMSEMPAIIGRLKAITAVSE